MSNTPNDSTASNGTQPNNGPREDATTRTRKQWSACAYEWYVPSWALFDNLEDADSERVLRYFFTSFRNRRGMDAYLADGYGTWLLLQDGARSCQAVVRAMILAGRANAADDMWEAVVDVSMVDKMAYGNYLRNDLKCTGGHVRAVALQLRQVVMGTDVAHNVAVEDFDRRNERPAIPLADGGGLDLTTGMTISPNQLSERLLMSHGWALPMIDKAILESQTEGAKAMREAIDDRFGMELIRRLARHALGISKSIDALIAPAGWGKSTLITIMELAFPGMVGRVESGRALSTGGDKFSVVTSLLASRLWVFVDESGGKVDKLIHGSILKTWVDDVISVERKGIDRLSRRRMGTAMFVGYDYPPVDMSDQGMKERFRWAYRMSDDPMEQEDRDLLVSPDAIEYFRQTLMSAAIALWQDGDIDDIELSDESEGALDEFIMKRSNPLALALRSEYELGDGKRDFVASAKVQLVLEEVADGEKVTGPMVRDAMGVAFHSPRVNAGRKTIEGEQIRVWMGIKESKPAYEILEGALQ